MLSQLNLARVYHMHDWGAKNSRALSKRFAASLIGIFRRAFGWSLQTGRETITHSLMLTSANEMGLSTPRPKIGFENRSFLAPSNFLFAYCSCQGETILHLTDPTTMIPLIHNKEHGVMCNSILETKTLQDEAAAYAWVESRLWPDGPVCPHCGGFDRISKMGGKSTRIGVYKCYQCRKQFSVKVGTVFEDSHVPMRLWLQAIFLLCSSKKGISSNQLHRTLGVTLRTAWFMSHRIREAMRIIGVPPMGGDGGIIEVDETFVGRVEGVPKQRTGSAHKNVVLTLVERGGEARSFHVDSTRHIQEAAKCLAFEIPTAAAFHIFRCAESILRRYYEAVVGKLPKRQMRNWGSYIRYLKECGADVRVITILEQIQDLHRNPVIHPETRMKRRGIIPNWHS
jgi:transposase-like protein